MSGHPPSTLRSIARTMGEVRLLTADEERDLFALRDGMTPEEWRASAARRALIESCLPLTVKLSRSWGDDGIQLAMILLIKAVDGFDPARGYRLATYVGGSIKRRLPREVTATTLPIHIPTVTFLLARRPPAPGEPGHVAEARAALRVAHFSALDPMGRGDYLAVEPDEPDEPGVVDGLDPRAARVRRAIARLPKSDGEVVTAYHLHGDGPKPSLEEIGRARGVTKQRVRQILRRAHHRLRRELGGPNP